MFTSDFQEILGLFKQAIGLARETSLEEAKAVADHFGKLNTRNKQREYLRSIIDKHTAPVDETRAAEQEQHPYV